MPSSLKAGIVVLAIAAVIFALAKPVALKFSAQADFARRRNIWFTLTALAFVSPSFWLFVLVAVPLLSWGGRKDRNPVAFYLLLLFVVPQIQIEIPTVGISSLLELDIFRLLSFCVLIPAARRLRRARDPAAISGWHTMDVLLILWGILQLALFVPPDLPGQPIVQQSLTGLLRRAVIFFIDIWVLWYVVSRSCSNRRALMEAMAAFCTSCAIMALIAIFESLRHWLLYADIAQRWTGASGVDVYLFRGGILRAQAAAGHSIALGYLLATALGFWFFLRSEVDSVRVRVGLVLLLWMGLIATYSRGPWMGGVAIYFFYAAMGPRAIPRLVKTGAIAAIALATVAASPIGERITRVLPFMGGSVDTGSITYRQQLAARSWELITQSPLFGDQHAFFKMEDLRQGEGIIDLVNTYAAVALFYGFVGLTLFAGFMLVGLQRAYRTSRRSIASDPGFARLGAALGACIVGTLLMLATCSFILSLEKMYYVLGGLAAAYAHLGTRPKPESVA